MPARSGSRTEMRLQLSASCSILAISWLISFTAPRAFPVVAAVVFQRVQALAFAADQRG